MAVTIFMSSSCWSAAGPPKKCTKAFSAKVDTGLPISAVAEIGSFDDQVGQARLDFPKMLKLLVLDIGYIRCLRNESGFRFGVATKPET
ncbi:MAG: hypothetical protein WCB34_05755, partial [Methylovirgula sp.]